MGKASPKTRTAQQIELIVRRLDCLSTLPSVVVRVLSSLCQQPAAAVAEIIESDPALTAKIFSLAYDEGVVFTDGRPCVREALDKLPAGVVRDIALSMKVFGAFDNGQERDEAAVRSREQLVVHSLAVACCAKGIGKLILAAEGAGLAYSAGLLHDMGKLALQEVMPRSFQRIAAEAKSLNASICSIEQQHLGLDHTQLGKHLAERWHLPREIVFAVWLHHSDTEAISEEVPAAGIARIVRLADLMVRGCGIGDSGSYDPPGGRIRAAAESLLLTNEQINQIRRALPQQVEDGKSVLGLDVSGVAAEYADAVRKTAISLAEQGGRLAAENRRLAVASAHLDFVTEFLSSIDANAAGIDIAEHFAVCWQKFYQTGPVCVYPAERSDDGVVKAAVVNEAGKSDTVVLKDSDELGVPAIPVELQREFAVLEACDQVGWLFEQLAVNFDLGKTRIAPLLACGRAVGAVVFELRYQPGAGWQQNQFATAASVGAVVIMLAFACEEQRQLSERFARLLGRPRQAPALPEPVGLLSVLAEMAAGAGHELNSPLAVISGRAQLLEEAETDAEKKKMLGQIRKKSEQITQIVSDLMSFAEPAKPVPETVGVSVLLDAAIKQAADRCRLRGLEVRMENIDGLREVFVDSRQMASAIGNILCNAVESYDSGAGPIDIEGGLDSSGDYVKLQIRDFGCGMDGQVLRKATQPFFSFKPAGRKRGMGLAQARRFIEINKGWLSMTSRPGEGTTVTILLPCA